ncbi:MAG: hypothetical protein KKA31_02150, partial [Candidatus Margulisbacteria bacterium]|nr:hypothetical protein [Candidatus Margulisiibacteriota bacterium]
RKIKGISLMDDHKIRKHLSGLDKVKAPRDFLEQVNARIEGKNKVFFPMPMRVATAVATMVLLLSVYSVYKYAGPTEEKLAKVESRASVARSAPKPVEIDDSSIMLVGAGASSGMAMDSVAGAPMMASSARLAGPTANPNYYQLKKLVEQHGGKVIQIDYNKSTGQAELISADIPVDNYTSFLIKLGSLGELRPPLPTESDDGYVRSHIKL